MLRQARSAANYGDSLIFPSLFCHISGNKKPPMWGFCSPVTSPCRAQPRPAPPCPATPGPALIWWKTHRDHGSMNRSPAELSAHALPGHAPPCQASPGRAAPGNDTIDIPISYYS
jgi:hypothetical protein